jgi:hypothetical protein
MPLGFISENEVETIVPVVAIFFIFGFPVLAWLIHRSLSFRERQLKYVERIEMIRHGMNPDADAKAAGGPSAGASRPAGFGDVYVPPPSGPSPHAQIDLSRGLVLTAVGLAITVGLSFIGMGPWLIGGLVPLFIGLARVLMALTSGAQLRFGPQFPPPSPPPPPNANFAERPAAPPTYEGSYTYRPGPTQELRPPPNPPTTRDQ